MKSVVAASLIAGASETQARSTRTEHEEKETGVDHVYYCSLFDALEKTPVPKTLLEAVMPLERLLKFPPRVTIACMVERTVDKMRAKLPHIKGGDSINLEYAAVINLYTSQDYKVYKKVSDIFHSPNRMTDFILSDDVMAALPFYKMLDEALKALPSDYHYQGWLFRGVKWAFPDLAEHETKFRQHFYPGLNLYWYEFKSTSYDETVAHNGAFSGRYGARTIFKVDVKRAYKIEAFSDFPKEKEVLVPILTAFRVVRSETHLQLDTSSLQDPFSKLHQGEPDIVELQQVNPQLGHDLVELQQSTGLPTPRPIPCPEAGQRLVSRTTSSTRLQCQTADSNMQPVTLADRHTVPAGHPNIEDPPPAGFSSAVRRNRAQLFQTLQHEQTTASQELASPLFVRVEKFSCFLQLLLRSDLLVNSDHDLIDDVTKELKAFDTRMVAQLSHTQGVCTHLESLQTRCDAFQKIFQRLTTSNWNKVIACEVKALVEIVQQLEADLQMYRQMKNEDAQGSTSIDDLSARLGSAAPLKHKEDMVKKRKETMESLVKERASAETKSQQLQGELSAARTELKIRQHELKAAMAREEQQRLEMDTLSTQMNLSKQKLINANMRYTDGEDTFNDNYLKMRQQITDKGLQELSAAHDQKIKLQMQVYGGALDVRKHANIDGCSFVALCDRSGSMMGLKFKNMVQGVLSLSECAGAHIFSAAMFNREVRVPFSNISADVLKLKASEIMSYRPEGGTALMPALQQATTSAAATAPDKMIIIILLSDGISDHSDCAAALQAARDLHARFGHRCHFFACACGDVSNASATFLKELVHEGNGGRSTMGSAGDNIEYFIWEDVGSVMQAYQRISAAASGYVEALRQAVNTEHSALVKCLSDADQAQVGLLDKNAEEQKKIRKATLRTQQNEVAELVQNQETGLNTGMEKLTAAQSSRAACQIEVATAMRNESAKRREAESERRHVAEAQVDFDDCLANEKATLKELQDSKKAACQFARRLGMVGSEDDRLLVMQSVMSWNSLRYRNTFERNGLLQTLEALYGFVNDFKDKLQLSAAQFYTSDEKLAMVFKWYQGDGGYAQVGCRPDEIRQSFTYLVQNIATKNGVQVTFASTIAQAIQPSRMLGFHGSPDEVTYAAARTDWLKQLESQVLGFIQLNDLDLEGEELRRLNAEKDLKYATMRAKDDIIRKYREESRVGEAEYEERLRADLAIEINAFDQKMSIARLPFKDLKIIIELVACEWENIFHQCLVEKDFADIRDKLEDQQEIIRKKVVPFIAAGRDASKAQMQIGKLSASRDISSAGLHIMGKELLAIIACEGAPGTQTPEGNSDT